MTKNQVMQVGELMTFQAAGQALGLTYWQLRRIITKHNVPTMRIGNTLLVRLADIPKPRG